MNADQSTRDREDRKLALEHALNQGNVQVQNGFGRVTSKQVIDVAERYRRFLAGEPEPTEIMGENVDDA